jgi:hypothetical protein
MRRSCQALLFAAMLSAAGAWIIDVPLAQSWAARRTPADPYAQFEALGAAEAAVWLFRGVTAVGALLALAAVRRSESLGRFLTRAWQGLRQATTVDPAGGAASGRRRPIATWVLRGALASWLLLAAGHSASAVIERLREWPVYRLRSGADVLPNMSQSNREVIRYLQHATPEDARILVASDQSLFFLSYYLWPRQVSHRTHPDAERVIPQPNQARQLAAYRLEDLGPEYVAAVAPDFVLEYFEGREYVDAERVFDDLNWIAFVRQLRGEPGFVPEYNVALRRISDEQAGP